MQNVPTKSQYAMGKYPTHGVHIFPNILRFIVQYNLNGSNPGGSFTVDDSNSFLVPTKSFQ